MANHTPPPWTPHADGTISAPAPISEPVAYAQGNRRDTDVLHANTRLIAAAPQLFENAQDVARLLRHMARGHSGVGNTRQAAELYDLARMLESPLREAEDDLPEESEVVNG